MSEDILKIILSVVSVIVVALVNKYLTTAEAKLEAETKASTYTRYALIALNYAEDIFQNDPAKKETISKIKFATEYMVAELTRLGFNISTTDAEAEIRTAYQNSDLNKVKKCV